MDSLRRQQLYDALASRILILDGAMGTMLQAYNPRRPTSAARARKLQRKTRAARIRSGSWTVHRAYLEAGADIIETNSFQGSPIVLAEFELEDKTHRTERVRGQTRAPGGG